MTIAITVDDVQDRLRRELTDDERVYFDAIVQEASDVVEGCLGFSYDIGAEIPSAVISVTSRIAARVYGRSSTAQEGADSRSAGMGQLSFTTHYSADSLTAGPWLSKTDRETLKRYRQIFVSVPMGRE